MIRKLYEIAADIVEAQASFAQMSPESLEQAFSTVFVTLQRMKMAEDGGFILDVAKPIEESVAAAPGKIDPKGWQNNKITLYGVIGLWVVFPISMAWFSTELK